MPEIFNFDNANFLDATSEVTLTLAGPKLHGIFVTQCKLDYHGSITIDQNILEIAGLYPLEYVNVWNKNNGARISTYVLPGEKNSGICCLNGAAARTCQIGDPLIVTSERSIPRKLLHSYKTNIITFNESNRITEVLQYCLDLAKDEVFSFSLPG